MRKLLSLLCLVSMGCLVVPACPQIDNLARELGYIHESECPSCGDQIFDALDDLI